MELKEYVKKSLLDIAEGVNEAISNSEEKKYRISPFEVKEAVRVKFHVSVETSIKGGANIKVVEAGASEFSNNTLEFEVPIMLPVCMTAEQKQNKEKRDKRPVRIDPLPENH